jgi:hypothetical protein
MSQLLKSLYAWGPNSSGELGLGDQTARLSPTLVGNSGDWQYVRGGLGLITTGDKLIAVSDGQGGAAEGQPSLTLLAKPE